MRAFLLLVCLVWGGDARRTQKASDAADAEPPFRGQWHEAAFSMPFGFTRPGQRNEGQLARNFGKTANALARSTMGRSSLRMAAEPPMSPWDIKEITPDGALAQRVEGQTRKTWKFNNLAKDRVQVALTSEGRPVNANIELWLGPDWTPFKLKAYSEDGKLRPIQTLVGTRNKQAMIEVRNIADVEFALTAAANYAEGEMATLSQEVSAATPGKRMDGGEIASFPVPPAADQVEVVLKTEGKQLNARIEVLNAPNNPKQIFEVFTNNGELNPLSVGINVPDSGATIRIVNLATMEFPCYAHVNPISSFGNGPASEQEWS